MFLPKTKRVFLEVQLKHGGPVVWDLEKGGFSPCTLITPSGDVIMQPRKSDAKAAGTDIWGNCRTEQGHRRCLGIAIHGRVTSYIMWRSLFCAVCEFHFHVPPSRLMFYTIYLVTTRRKHAQGQTHTQIHMAGMHARTHESSHTQTHTHAPMLFTAINSIVTTIRKHAPGKHRHAHTNSDTDSQAQTHTHTSLDTHTTTVTEHTFTCSSLQDM